MSLIDNFFNKDYDDIFADKIEELDKSGPYPISQYHAFEIAEQPHNLKNDYFKNADKYISYLDFTDCKIELVDGDNGRKYWLIKITGGKFSSIDTSDDDTTVFSDGRLGKKDFKLLQCLIDVNTGEYYFYPE